MPISIEGADELIERLQNLKPELLDAAKQGAEHTMQLMKKDAVANCPVDTGMLRGSIQTEVKLEQDALHAKLYTPMEYALYVEMGTGVRGEAHHEGTAPGATYDPQWPGQPAHPFLYPAFKANKAQLLNDIREAIRKKLNGGG